MGAFSLFLLGAGGETDGLLTKCPSFFKTLIDHEVTVELKNDIQIRGILKSVDQYLNIKLDNIQVLEEIKYPHMVRRDQSSSVPWMALLMGAAAAERS